VLLSRRLTTEGCAQEPRVTTAAAGVARTVDLRRVPTTLDADAQVHDGESLAAEQQDRLEDLVAQQHGLNQLDRAAVDLDQAPALFALRDGNSILLAAEGLH
jgi:flagellar hook-length control protein FliK